MILTCNLSRISSSNKWSTSSSFLSLYNNIYLYLCVQHQSSSLGDISSSLTLPSNVAFTHPSSVPCLLRLYGHFRLCPHPYDSGCVASWPCASSVSHGLNTSTGLFRSRDKISPRHDKLIRRGFFLRSLSVQWKPELLVVCNFVCYPTAWYWIIGGKANIVTSEILHIVKDNHDLLTSRYSWST